jgi:hypothetical protein
MWISQKIFGSPPPQILGSSQVNDTTTTFIAEFYDLSATTFEFDTLVDGGFSLSYIVR